MKFYEQLLLTITDKLTIGLIILFVGLWINKKLERFRIELSRLSKEHEIRFSKLQERRGEVISELYSLLYEAKTNLGVLELGIKSGVNEALLEEIAKETSESSGKAMELFKQNRLYLSKELADSIHSVLSAFKITSASYPYPEIRTGVLEQWEKQSQDISSIMNKLENEFRIMLGSESRMPN